MAESLYDIRKLKITKWTGLILQIVLVALIFVPAAVLSDSGTPVNSLQMGILYLHHGGLLHIMGGGLYCALLFAVPVAIWLVTLLRKPRLNYGICVALCALEAISSSCFYTMALHRMNAIFTMNFLRYVVVVLELVAMFIYIHAYFQAWQGSN